MTSQELLEKQRQYLWPNHILYYYGANCAGTWQGADVWDADDKRYLDFFGGILTTRIRHIGSKLSEQRDETQSTC